MIDNTTIERVSDAADIVEVVSDYIDLKKRGVNMLGVCPFHNEKTPSFTVSPSKGIFKCFGCGEGGDSITFIMGIERTGFLDAVRLLAKKYSIKISEEEESDDMKALRKERDSRQIILTKAADIYQENLHSGEIGRTKALPYLTKMGFRNNTLELFGVGFTGADTSLFAKMREVGFKEDLLIKSGLVFRTKDGSKDGKVIDTLQRRVTMPIYNTGGRVCSIYGQTAQKISGVPLHKFTTDPLLFQVDKELFGLYQNKGDIVKEKSCYLVANPFEVLLLHLSGITSSVTPLTPTITKLQIERLKRFTSNVVILFSGNSNDMPSLYNTVLALLKEECTIRIIDVKEPIAALLTDNSASVVKEKMESNNEDWFSALYQIMILSQAPAEREDNIRRVLSLLSAISNPIIKGVYIEEASRLLKVSESAIKSTIK